MSINNILINYRALTLLNPINAELNFDINKNYFFNLSYINVLDVKGNKSAEFLQGQLSCDINHVNANTMRKGAMCNLQGRIMSLLDVIDWNGLHLIVPSDLANITQTILSKTAIFSRVTLQNNSSLSIFGFYLQNPKDFIPFNAILPSNITDVIYATKYACYKCAENLYVFLVNTADINDIKLAINQNQQRGSLAWHLLKIYRGLIEIYPNSHGIFLPHRLELQKTSILSFDKGCYKGQEIIARTQYRAKLKHSMKKFIVETKEPIYSGQIIHDSNNKLNIGELIDYCPITRESYLIAISSLFEHDTSVIFDGQKSISKLHGL